MSNFRKRRPGYALMLVLVFMTLLFALSSLAFRSVGTSLRSEAARSARQLRDEGSLSAAALAMALLETGLPPTNPYQCGVTVDTSRGPRGYTVDFSSDGDVLWTVSVSLTPEYVSLDPMPESFASP
jgi:hypothetical protein